DQYEEMTEQPDQPLGKPCGDLKELTVEGLSCAAGELSILKDVSAKFLPGEKYLITGESGSGKSTLLRLIARVGELGYAGKICWNGTELGELAESGLYEKLCPVFQEPYLFYASLSENILLGRKVSEETYRKIIQKLNLGYLLERCGDRELDAKAVEQLSGGERQRIALARAMVGAPQIYLLDEVTSALDQKTARLIEELMLSQEATVIHISHKPNPELLPRYQVHLHMRDGRLVEAASEI
ncbi:MAG: ATP-binding cassette domain-containing protein, partial [Oscillospiraceae bacterium]|nr:ATP-binding cassette domain-containing protein [Oscillospiraceae bacterium]